MQKGRTVGGGGHIEEISGISRFVGAYLLLASECMIVDTARNEKYKIRVSERFALTNRPSLQRGRGGKDAQWWSELPKTYAPKRD